LPNLRGEGVQNFAGSGIVTLHRGAPIASVPLPRAGTIRCSALSLSTVYVRSYRSTIPPALHAEALAKALAAAEEGR
jgi:hypothetical protein